MGRIGILSDESVADICREYRPIPQGRTQEVLYKPPIHSIVYQVATPKDARMVQPPDKFKSLAISLAKVFSPTNKIAFIANINNQYRNQINAGQPTDIIIEPARVGGRLYNPPQIAPPPPGRPVGVIPNIPLGGGSARPSAASSIYLSPPPTPRSLSPPPPSPASPPEPVRIPSLGGVGYEQAPRADVYMAPPNPRIVERLHAAIRAREDRQHATQMANVEGQLSRLPLSQLREVFMGLYNNIGEAMTTGWELSSGARWQPISARHAEILFLRAGSRRDAGGRARQSREDLTEDLLEMMQYYGLARSFSFMGDLIGDALEPEAGPSEGFMGLSEEQFERMSETALRAQDAGGRMVAGGGGGRRQAQRRALPEGTSPAGQREQDEIRRIYAEKRQELDRPRPAPPQGGV